MSVDRESLKQTPFARISHACYLLDSLKCDIDNIKGAPKLPPNHPDPRNIVTVAQESLKAFQEVIPQVNEQTLKLHALPRDMQVLLPQILIKATNLVERILKNAAVLSQDHIQDPKIRKLLEQYTKLLSGTNIQDPKKMELLETYAQLLSQAHIHDPKIQELLTTAITCEVNFIRTRYYLSHADPLPHDEKPVDIFSEWCLAGVRAAKSVTEKLSSTFLSPLVLKTIKSEHEEVKKSIQHYETQLRSVCPSSNDIPVKFVDTLSTFITRFLEEHLVHIDEREPALRPSWLRHCFDNLYEMKPKKNFLGSVLIPLLEQKDTQVFVTDVIRINLLKALSQGLGNLNELKKEPYFLTKLFHQVLDTTIEHVKSEIEGRSEGSHGINLITVEERTNLLSNSFQKGFVSSILSFAFPGGANDLEIPTPKVMNLLGAGNYTKNFMWPNLTDLLESMTTMFFTDLSKNDNLKQQLLITGYEEINSFLSGESLKDSPIMEQEAIPSLNRQEAIPSLTRVSLVTFGIITTLFSVIIGSIKSIFKKTSTYESTYDQQPQLNKKIEETLTWLTKGYRLQSLFVRFFGKKIIETAGTCTVKALEEIDIHDFLCQQLKSVIEILDPSRDQLYMARTAAQERENEDRLKKEHRRNRETLISLRTEFASNIDGLVQTMAENLCPTEPYRGSNKGLVRRIQYLARCFLQTCIRKIISATTTLIRFRRRAQEIERKMANTADTIDQDALLTSISRQVSQKLVPPPHA